MAKGVLTHRADSIYDDLPAERYQFPKRYLNRVRTFQGDWVVYYEPRRGGGRLGYNAIAKIQEVIPDPRIEDMFIAIMESGSFVPLEQFVHYKDQIGYLETGLGKSDGSLNRGNMQWAVRPISDHDFFRVLARGFPAEPELLPRSKGDLEAPPAARVVRESPQPFIFDAERERVETTVTRTLRDRAFRKHILTAYDSTCAITGFKFINGGGRAEVEAAHIKPVTENGPDSIRNGLALSGTIHWMFDRGLISLSDEFEILVSRQLNNPDEVWRLANADKRARVPVAENLKPHSQYLKWHRTNCFKS